MKFLQITLVCTVLSAPLSHAQWEEDWNPWETDTELGASLVLAPEADEEALGRIWFGLSTNRILDNGVRIGVAGRVEAQKDHPGRAGFSGVIEGVDRAGPSLQGAFTGLAIGLPAEESGVRGEIEAAYLYVEGGYGDVRLGRDLGIAARFSEGAPSVFQSLATGRQTLDPTGLDMVTTRHDLTGPSAKLSYATPRLIGIQAGISFTPAADVRGLDRDADRTLPGTTPVNLENAVEGAVNVSRLLRESGVRLRGSLAASTADISTPPYASGWYDRVTTWSAGASAEFETVSVGVSWLSSDNGLTGAGAYESWTAGVTKSLGEVILGAEFGRAEDELLGRESETWRIGLSHAFTEYARISLGYGENSLDSVDSVSIPRLGDENSPDGVVIEITLSR